LHVDEGGSHRLPDHVDACVLVNVDPVARHSNRTR
jgi:hypothetical protein